MKYIPFLNTILKVKILFLAPFTSKSADFCEMIRLKGAEKQAGSLRNGLENQAVSLPNTNIIDFGTVAET